MTANKTIDCSIFGNRPEELEDLAYYKSLPNMPIGIDPTYLPTILKLDCMTMSGIKPLTSSIVPLVPEGFEDNPNPLEIEHYQKKDTKFQIVFLVANAYGFKVRDNYVVGRPYSLYAIPATKRGKPETVTIDWLRHFDLGNMPLQDNVYCDLNPFTGNALMYAPLEAALTGGYTDTIGFIIDQYFLKQIDNDDEILHPGFVDDPLVQKAWLRQRNKKFFSWFSNIQSRKIWGADSPIELFLLHALSREDLFPEIQTLILDDGRIYTSFYNMFENEESQRAAKILTEVDLFFPAQKVAVFCDSHRFHRTKTALEKDERITKSLSDIGIKSLRLHTKDILHDLAGCVSKIKALLSV